MICVHIGILYSIRFLLYVFLFWGYVLKIQICSVIFNSSQCTHKLPIVNIQDYILEPNIGFRTNSLAIYERII